jgi:hypothetical protein
MTPTPSSAPAASPATEANDTTRHGAQSFDVQDQALVHDVLTPKDTIAMNTKSATDSTTEANHRPPRWRTVSIAAAAMLVVGAPPRQCWWSVRRGVRLTVGRSVHDR